jgi:hypothetical protein
MPAAGGATGAKRGQKEPTPRAKCAASAHSAACTTPSRVGVEPRYAVVGGGGIDEVGVVRDHAGQSRGGDCGPERLGFGRRDRSRVPAVDVAREDLQALAAGLDGPIDRLGQAPRHRLMRAEETVGGAGRPPRPRRLFSPGQAWRPWRLPAGGWSGLGTGQRVGRLHARFLCHGGRKSVRGGGA